MVATLFLPNDATNFELATDLAQGVAKAVVDGGIVFGGDAEVAFDVLELAAGEDDFVRKAAFFDEKSVEGGADLLAGKLAVVDKAGQWSKQRVSVRRLRQSRYLR